MKKLDEDAIIIGFFKFILIWSFVLRGKKADKIEKVPFIKGYFHFNEPNSKISSYPSILDKIMSYIKDYNGYLEDDLFNINNIILEEIVQGRNLNIPNYPMNNNLNFVGGYVTLSLLKRENKYCINILNNSKIYNFYSSYSANKLLDGVSDPFSPHPNQKEIKYIDNLAMIFRACINSENKTIKTYLIKWIKLQLDFLVKDHIISCFLVNDIIKYINAISDLKLTTVLCTEEDLQLVIPDDEVLGIDFYKNFFDH